MRCALASMGFRNEDLTYNKKVIMNTMVKYSKAVDIVIFGEAFLQGFYGATFDTEHDDKLAITQNDSIIKDISSIARQYAVAVSFGFLEKANGKFYSSQMTIDACGQTIDVYRRVSPGWKEAFANKNYCEGTGFHFFDFMGKRIVIGLCGDLWYEENVRSVRQLFPDIVFWPVYTDFDFHAWNTTIKQEYAAQAGELCDNVLYVNSVCLDKTGDEIAKGGAALFSKGEIAQEVPAGKEDVLIVAV